MNFYFFLKNKSLFLETIIEEITEFHFSRMLNENEINEFILQLNCKNFIIKNKYTKFKKKNPILEIMFVVLQKHFSF